MDSQALLTPEQTGEFLGLTTAALAQLRYLGRGPRYVRVSAKAIRYRPQDLEAFVEENLRTSTSGPA